MMKKQWHSLSLEVLDVSMTMKKNPPGGGKPNPDPTNPTEPNPIEPGNPLDS
ncbi:hypothetical protein BTS2_2286 [Bacillus sp. TS-2]|nr:hypothetical protein BTS2_2286 [Bacillus sp. TS-2]